MACATCDKNTIVSRVSFECPRSSSSSVVTVAWSASVWTLSELRVNDDYSWWTERCNSQRITHIMNILYIFKYGSLRCTFQHDNTLLLVMHKYRRTKPNIYGKQVTMCLLYKPFNSGHFGNYRSKQALPLKTRQFSIIVLLVLTTTLTH